MPTSIVPAAFENIEESHEIAVRIGVRLSERVSHARLAREVNNVGKTMFTEQRRNHAAVGEVDLLETECCERRELGEPRPFEARVIIRIEVIDADHGTALYEEPPGDVEPEEAGRPGDEDRLAFWHRLGAAQDRRRRLDSSANAARSASTISRTSSSNKTLCRQPSRSRAFDGSPRSSPTSVGRK